LDLLYGRVNGRSLREPGSRSLPSLLPPLKVVLVRAVLVLLDLRDRPVLDRPALLGFLDLLDFAQAFTSFRWRRCLPLMRCSDAAREGTPGARPVRSTQPARG